LARLFGGDYAPLRCHRRTAYHKPLEDVTRPRATRPIRGVNHVEVVTATMLVKPQVMPRGTIRAWIRYRYVVAGEPVVSVNREFDVVAMSMNVVLVAPVARWMSKTTQAGLELVQASDTDVAVTAVTDSAGGNGSCGKQACAVVACAVADGFETSPLVVLARIWYRYVVLGCSCGSVNAVVTGVRATVVKTPPLGPSARKMSNPAKVHPLAGGTTVQVRLTVVGLNPPEARTSVGGWGGVVHESTVLEAVGRADAAAFGLTSADASTMAASPAMTNFLTMSHIPR